MTHHASSTAGPTAAADALVVLHGDDRLVAVAKPSGLAVHRGWAAEATTALSLLRDRLGQRVYPVHRLDRATSGVLVFALDPQAARRLQAGFAAGEVDKRYVALVRGHGPESLCLDHPVPRTPRGPRVPAVTELRRLAVFERFSLMAARPRTGRLHQIRRHLKHLSHPLVGDVRYGKGEVNRLFRQRFGLARLALHAVALRFPHPDDGRRVALLAPLPADLAGPFRAMGLPTEPSALDPWEDQRLPANER